MSTCLERSRKNVKMITKKQRAVIEDLFAGEANEQQVLDRHKVSQKVYEKWQTDEFFLREFDLRLKRQRRLSEMIIARYATFAAAKLVQLTESANQETARKACLDIITLLRPPPKTARFTRRRFGQSSPRTPARISRPALIGPGCQRERY
jgi:hypothetical protein